MSVNHPSWTLRMMIKRAGEVLRQDGVKALAFGVLGELGYRRSVLFQLELNGYRQDEGATPEKIRFELLSEDRVDELLQLVRHCDEREARRRIAAGHLCVLGYVDDKAAYSAWLAVGSTRIDYLDVTIVPDPGLAYSYELYVHPSARGLGLAKLGMDFRIRLLRERGFQSCLSTVVPENSVGMAHALARGFQPIGQAHCLKAGSRFKRFWLRPYGEHMPLRLAR